MCFLRIISCYIVVFLVSCSVLPTEIPNAELAQSKVTELLQTLQSNDIAKARGLYSNEVNLKVTDEDLLNGLKMHAFDKRILTIKSVKICEWGIMVGDGNTLMNAIGILTSAYGEVVFTTTLRRDNDGKWRLMGFILRDDITAQAIGRCL